MIHKTCLILFAFMAGAVLATDQDGQSDADQALAAREIAASVVTARTASGRFIVVGKDRFDVHDLSRWIEDLALRYLKITDQKLPQSSTPLIRVYVAREDGAPSAVTSASRRESKFLSHSISVVNYESTIVELLMEEVSRCLTLTILEHAQRKVEPRPARTVVPFWLTQGIAQNLYPELRKRNSETMLAKWLAGTMPPLSGLLSDDTTDVDPEELRKARGVLVGWFLSFGRDAAVLPHIFAETARTGSVTAEQVDGVLATAGVFDEGQAWDAWMLRQKRMVYLPGSTAIKDLLKLRRLLLIYPEDFDIQLPNEGSAGLDVHALMRHKKNEGVRQAAKSRFIELQLSAAGRDESFTKLAAAYGKFFMGVAEKKADWRLRGYLKDAEKMLRAFEIEILSVKAIADTLGKEAVTK